MYNNRNIAVIGARNCDDRLYRIAEETGNILAESGYTIICGGLGGVMEAVCKGAKAANGLTIGILPGDNPEEANPYIDMAIATGMGISRNLIIIRSSIGVIAINGGFGTLSELAFALQLQKPVIGLETWDISDQIDCANNPRDAVQKLKKRISG